jgi:hypothetical protein
VVVLCDFYFSDGALGRFCFSRHIRAFWFSEGAMALSAFHAPAPTWVKREIHGGVEMVMNREVQPSIMVDG